MTQNGKLQWKRKDLLGLRDLSVEEIMLILDTAKSFGEVSQREVKKVPVMRGKTVVNLFLEPSTRTRVSFELAEKRLSADTISMASAGSSMSKGESLWDTIANIEALKVDIIVMRHGSSGGPASRLQLHEVRDRERGGRDQRAPHAGTFGHLHAS